MRRDRHAPPPKSSGTYKEPNIRYAAIPNKGIAAFFYSTGFYVSVYIMTHIASIFNLHFPIFVWESIFLSIHEPGKLRSGRPRCRSPPLQSVTHQPKTD